MKKLNALVITRDPASLCCLTAALQRLEIEAEICSLCSRAMESLVERSYAAVIVDFDEPDAAQVARMVRLARADRPPLLVALITELGPVAGAFQAGIKFVLYKPLKPSNVAQSLWDARQFMRRERRRAHREEVKALV